MSLPLSGVNGPLFKSAQSCSVQGLEIPPQIKSGPITAELGVQPHMIEAVLNHVSGHKGGVAGIYNRAKYEPEMRSALQRWADYLDQSTA